MYHSREMEGIVSDEDDNDSDYKENIESSEPWMIVTVLALGLGLGLGHGWSGKKTSWEGSEEGCYVC